MEKKTLTKLIVLISELCQIKGNEWFKSELRKLLSINEKYSDNSESVLIEIRRDTSKVINYLEINPDCSIDYSFIDHKLLRTRLELDNLRMENVRYYIREKDEMKRIYDYCINAFYQIENLINYYYYEKYPKIDDLLAHLEQIENSSFKRKAEKNVGDITISTKIYAFTKSHYNEKSDTFLGMDIDSLRVIRNEGLHRCSRIKNFENENKRLHQFIKFATFDSVHSIVNSLTLKIKNLLAV